MSKKLSVSNLLGIKYLNENDYLVTTANSAEDAMEKIKVIEFDLIILDIMMPGKSGLDFINEKKKELETH